MQGTDINGLYNTATVTGFTGGKKQTYTGTDVGGFRHGMGFPGERPEGMGESPEGMQKGEMPIDMEPGQRPEGGPMDGDFARPGEAGRDDLPASDLFILADKVNAFSGIADEENM